jgi:hypothetical protein
MQPWRRMFEESGAAASTIRRLGRTFSPALDEDEPEPIVGHGP